MSKEEISFTETEVTELTGLIVKTLQLWRCPDVDQIQQRERFYGLQSIRAASQRCRKKQDENGKNMNHITLDQPNQIATTIRKRTRNRRPPPPLEARNWMTPNETALALG